MLRNGKQVELIFLCNSDTTDTCDDLEAGKINFAYEIIRGSGSGGV